MINKGKFGKIRALLITAGVFSLLAAVYAAVTCYALVPLPGVFAAVPAAVGAVLAVIGAQELRREAVCLEETEKNIEGFAFIRFDKLKKTALLSSNFTEVTGITVSSSVVGEDEYSSIIKEMVSSRLNSDEDIYMTSIADKWIKVCSSGFENYEFIEIIDVSKYVACKNVIRSLKYYDKSTGVLSSDAFASQVRKSSEMNAGTLGVINFVLSGMDSITSFAGNAAAEKIISKVAAYIKKYENPHNIFTGRTASNEFSVLITETYEDGCRKLADKICSGIQEMLSGMSGDEKGSVRVFCGYACFSGSDNDVGTILAHADFAAFDAENSGALAPVAFSGDDYELKAQEFRKVQVFEQIIENSYIDYHFQPIVNARTGEIFGYEALMRPHTVDGIRLSPLEVLDIAKQQEMLYKIEQITFSSTMKILSENQDFFSTRKMFINCIPNALLSDEDFLKLADTYGSLFDKIVVEVTEENPVFDSAVKTLDERLRSRRTQIALDDYGTGYSNDSTLLAVKPEYIKIDRSIIKDIDKDIQRQHLVANMVDFASQHGIMALGEGVETLEELETVISLGVDLIQGYITCRATAVLMLEIPLDIKNHIINFNLKHKGKVSRIYRITEPETADIVELGLAGFNEIFITSKQAVLKGDPDTEVNMKITCDAEPESRLRLENVNIVSDDSSVLTLAKGSEVNMEIEGRSTFKRGGIRVPEGAKLFVSGAGSLDISDNKVSSFGIGGSCMQNFGKIMLACEGEINVSCKGDNVIGIGGGIGSADSLIKIISGTVRVKGDGKDIVGIGSFAGDTSVFMNPVNAEINMGGEKVIGVGSRSGRVNIDSAANINAQISGDTCCCIGAFEKGSGNIIINGGRSSIVVKGKNIAGIGAIGGNMETTLNAGFMDILCEGNLATGVGDLTGSGSVKCRGTSLKAICKASEENPLGVKNGKVYVSSGTIETSNVEPIECYSFEGERLVQFRTDGREPFRRTMKSGESTYLYTAAPTGEEYMYVYIPEAYADKEAEA